MSKTLPTTDLAFQLLSAANYIDALGGDSKSYRAAIEAQGVPDGWQLVPKEPTEGMYFAGDDALAECKSSNTVPTGPVYRAMLASAPPAPQAAVVQQEPVRWVVESDLSLPCCAAFDHPGIDYIPLYLHPAQQAKPLTDEQQMIEMVDAAMVATANISPRITRSQCETIIRAALGIKGE